jgi:hypothetical protein
MADVNERVTELVCRLFVTLESAASLDTFCGSFSEFEADFLDFFHKTPLGLKALVSALLVILLSLEPCPLDLFLLDSKTRGCCGWFDEARESHIT